MTDIAYCTRTQVQDALAQADTYRSNTRIDAAIRTGGNQVRAACHRNFHPTTCTRYPEITRVTGPVLWLDTDWLEMCSVTAFSVDGLTLTEGTDFFLRPDSGPPYTSLKLIDTSAASFSSLDRAMALTGEQGGSNTTRAAGALNGAITSNQPTIGITDSSLIGVGDLLTIGTERMNVVGQVASTTGATLAGGLTASNGARSVTVSDGTLIHEGERIQVGPERMFVESIAGSVLTVRRGDQGSILASHSTSDVVYAPRLLTVERGATGTTASSHADAATITANDPPALVKEANLAYALVNLEQSKSAYGRVLGSGDNQREASGRGLAQIVDELISAHGRLRLGSA